MAHREMEYYVLGLRVTNLKGLMMTKRDDLNKVAMSGFAMLICGIFVAFLGLFAYADMPNVKSIVTMMVGVLLTSLGYALLYLYYYLRNEAEYKEKEQHAAGCVGCH